MMVKKIALFNHKGGVSKTTTAFNLGWMMASLGKRVILVDADPQCNLTGLVLGYKGPYELEKFYEIDSKNNIRDGLAPAFESRPGQEIEPIECIPISGIDGLFLLPGHIALAEYEVTLGIAQELSGSIQTLQNLPGSISYLLNVTAKKYNADYVIIDMNPSLSSINQNLLMTSDYFIVPANTDFFSVMAINSLVKVIPIWHEWAKRARSHFKNASYAFPDITPKFLGTIIQKYRPRKNAPAKAFQKWIDEIGETVSNKLVKVLSQCDMLLPGDYYSLDYTLSTIPDFNSLIAISQEKQTPVFALTDEQVAQTGKVLENTKENIKKFKEIFLDMANKVIELTTMEVKM